MLGRLQKIYLITFPQRGMDPHGDPAAFQQAVDAFKAEAEGLSTWGAIALWFSCFVNLPTYVPEGREQSFLNTFKNFFGWKDKSPEQEKISRRRVLWNVCKAPFFFLFNAALFIFSIINIPRLITEFGPAELSDLFNEAADAAFAEWKKGGHHWFKSLLLFTEFFIEKTASHFFTIMHFAGRAIFSPGLRAPWKDGEKLGNIILDYLEIEKTSLSARFFIFLAGAGLALTSAAITIAVYAYFYPLLISAIIKPILAAFVSSGADLPVFISAIVENVILPIAEVLTVIGKYILVATGPFYAAISSTVLTPTAGWAVVLSSSITLLSSAARVGYQAAKSKLQQWWGSAKGNEGEKELNNSKRSSSARMSVKLAAPQEHEPSCSEILEDDETVGAYNEGTQKGDILIFKPGQQSWHCIDIPTLLKTGQLLFSFRKHGHYDSLHVGICIGHDEKGQALIAHVTHSMSGYIVEPIEDMFIRDNKKRAFSLFRPNDASFADALVQVALRPNEKKGEQPPLIYATKKALTDTPLKPFQSNKVSEDLKEHSQENYCSQFVVETIAIVSQENREAYKEYVNEGILTAICTKDLEAELTGNLYTRYVCNPENAGEVMLDKKYHPEGIEDALSSQDVSDEDSRPSFEIKKGYN